MHGACPSPPCPSVLCLCLTTSSKEKQHLLGPYILMGPYSWNSGLGTRRGAFPIAKLSAPWDPGPLELHGLPLNVVALEEREVGSQMKGSGGVSLGRLMRELKVHGTPVYRAVAVKAICGGKLRHFARGHTGNAA